MVNFHNIMVNKHNSLNQILAFLLDNKKEELTIRAIAQKTSIDYKTTHTIIKDLSKQGIIDTKKVGQTVLCKTNNSFDENIFIAETMRKEKILKNKDIKVIHKYIAETKSIFFVLLIFGSYTSGKNTKNSDIDLLLIADDKNTIESINNKLKLLPKEIHLVNFSTKEFVSMLKTTDFNVGIEAANNNVILFGIEDYYRILKNAYRTKNQRS